MHTKRNKYVRANELGLRLVETNKKLHNCIDNIFFYAFYNVRLLIFS